MPEFARANGAAKISSALAHVKERKIRCIMALRENDCFGPQVEILQIGHSAARHQDQSHDAFAAKPIVNLRLSAKLVKFKVPAISVRNSAIASRHGRCVVRFPVLWQVRSEPPKVVLPLLQEQPKASARRRPARCTATAPAWH